jgi:hypothetical protein
VRSSTSNEPGRSPRAIGTIGCANRRSRTWFYCWRIKRDGDLASSN